MEVSEIRETKERDSDIAWNLKASGQGPPGVLGDVGVDRHERLRGEVHRRDLINGEVQRDTGVALNGKIRLNIDRIDSKCTGIRKYRGNTGTLGV